MASNWAAELLEPALQGMANLAADLGQRKGRLWPLALGPLVLGPLRVCIDLWPLLETPLVPDTETSETCLVVRLKPPEFIRVKACNFAR